MIEKNPSKRGKTTKVTFELPADVAESSVAIVGDFNDWSPKKHQMKLDKKDNVWRRTIQLEKGSAYEFRYYVDETTWRNDKQADRYSSTPSFSENSVIEL